MTSALERALSAKALGAVWSAKAGRLRRSCFGPDRISGVQFGSKLQRQISDIVERTKSDFKSQGLLAIAKPKDSGKDRIICVPTIADRLIQFSILNELRPRLKAMKIDNAISFGIAATEARSVIGARKVACKARDEHPWVYKADIHQFFDNLARENLKNLLRRRVRIKSLWPVLEAFVYAEITDGIEKGWRKRVTSAGIVKGVGVRQGMPLSPFFAGLYLVDLDQMLIASGARVVRYADDIAAFFQSESECRRFHQMLTEALAAIQLEIGEPNELGSKTQIYRPGIPADFLGMEIAQKTSGRYELRVSEKVIDKVSSKINLLSDPSVLMENDVRLTTMGSHFAAMLRGYRNAYRGAQNADHFEVVLNRRVDAAQRAVLETLFGDRLTQLTTKQLEFVGVSDFNVHSKKAG